MTSLTPRQDTDIRYFAKEAIERAIEESKHWTWTEDRLDSIVSDLMSHIEQELGR